MYSKIAAHFQENATLKTWPELQKLLVSIINEKPKHINIPKLIANSYGGAPEALLAASASLALAFAGIVILDDVLDGDRRYGTDTAALANMSAALFSLADQPLAQISQDPHQVMQSYSVLSEMLFKVALGQSLDVRNPDSEEAYWQIAQLKSGAFFAGAFRLGGLAGGAPEADLQTLRLLGEEYGLLLQIHDDLSDALAVPANSDWTNGRFNLPILFAYAVDHPWRDRFEAIRLKVTDPELLKEAQEILIKCGALSYGLYQIQEHAEQVKGLLGKLSLHKRDSLIRLFDELIVPATEMVDALTTGSGENGF